VKKIFTGEHAAKMLVPSLFVLVATFLTASGASATVSAVKPAKSVSIVVTTRKLPKLGSVLASSAGRTLYMFVPDKQKKVTCVGSCAAVWPPLKLPTGAKLVATGGAKASLLGSDPDPAGGRVLTYDKWPLYTWVGDRAAGQDTGQALNANGGLWYVISPSGQVIKTALHATATPVASTTAASTTATSTPAETTAAAPPPTTTTATMPTTSANTDGCPAGQTIVSEDNANGGDQDDDDSGGLSDGDGCV